MPFLVIGIAGCSEILDSEPVLVPPGLEDNDAEPSFVKRLENKYPSTALLRGGTFAVDDTDDGYGYKNFDVVSPKPAKTILFCFSMSQNQSSETIGIRFTYSNGKKFTLLSNPDTHQTAFRGADDFSGDAFYSGSALCGEITSSELEELDSIRVNPATGY